MTSQGRVLPRGGARVLLLGSTTASRRRRPRLAPRPRPRRRREALVVDAQACGEDRVRRVVPHAHNVAVNDLSPRAHGRSPSNAFLTSLPACADHPDRLTAAGSPEPSPACSERGLRR